MIRRPPRSTQGVSSAASDVYKRQVIGVPSNSFKQEPGDNKEIKSFCESTFGITFPITEKNNVIGSNAHSFFKWAKENHGVSAIPKWNCHNLNLHVNLLK